MFRHDDVTVDHEVVFLSCFFDGVFTDSAGLWSVQIRASVVTTECYEVQVGLCVLKPFQSPRHGWVSIESLRLILKVTLVWILRDPG